MYTRSYARETDMSVPDGYGGTMLGCDEGTPDAEPPRKETDATLTSLFTRLIPPRLGGLLPPSLFKDMKIGTEEILIGAIALFLLFSKSGDKECALMLLLLLFIN